MSASPTPLSPLPVPPQDPAADPAPPLDPAAFSVPGTLTQLPAVLDALPPAEPGSSTSEFRGLLGASVALTGGTVTVLADFGTKFTPTEKTDLMALTGLLLMFGWSAYGWYRSWRKKGTPG